MVESGIDIDVIRESLPYTSLFLTYKKYRKYNLFRLYHQKNVEIVVYYEGLMSTTDDYTLIE